MRRDDPLDEIEWMLLDRFLTKQEFSTKRIAELRAATAAALDQITDLLDNPPPRRSWHNIHLWGLGGGLGVAAEDVPRAQVLCRRVAEAGGTGSLDIQETLLKLINQTEEPVSVPFWVELLDYARPRDQFAERRRTHALAGLARLVIRRDDGVALAALRQAMHHRRDEVRALAVHYLGRAVLYVEDDGQDQEQEAARPPRPAAPDIPLDDAELVIEDDIQDQESEEDRPPRPIAPAILAELNEIAVSDPAFSARFQARAVLREAGQPVPMDNPDGAYAFKVSLEWAKVSRTIELRSEQTLDDLHFAIQNAFGWDSDHLYCFYITGKEDDRYTFACPHEEDRPPWTDEALIGELGLVKGHSFAYLFDYGDSHVFTIKVEDIQPKAGRGKYPRVVEKQGEAPEQYPEI